MKRVYEACKPREEVLSGQITMDLFAAKLGAVVRGTAPPVYSDADRFFANTYPTEGLKQLVRTVFGRLAGMGGNALIRLEAAFGGGKTHGLIALYHAAREPAKAPEELLPADLRPAEPIRTAVLVGSDFQPTGWQREDVTVRTLWGEMAWQLGGREAWELVAETDRQGLAPSAEVLERILGDQPVLVMIDEIPLYLRQIGDLRLGAGSLLREQVPAFLQNLSTAAAVRPRAVVVVTLTGEQDAYAEEAAAVREALIQVSQEDQQKARERLLEGLSEIRAVLAREELVLQPTRNEEVPHVVVRRLFEEVDRQAAAEVAKAYHQYYVEAEEKQGADLPPRACRPEYREEIERTYPFHPELLRVLMTKTATIPEFERTRGALRLLARVVYRVWQKREEDAWLIHPFHVDLSDEQIRAELTSRIRREEFVPAIEADIFGQDKAAHAQELDKDWLSSGRPPLPSRIAHVIFLHSLTHGQAGRADVPDIFLACAQPGLDAELLRQALASLHDSPPGKACWYLHYDEHAYWFATEAGYQKVLDEYINTVTQQEAKDECRKRLRSVYKSVHLRSVFFPELPADVDDDREKIKLCVMDFDVVALKGAEHFALPETLTRIYERSGMTEGFRQYKNALIFLVAAQQEISQMINAAREHIALQRIVNNPDVMARFPQASQRQVRQRRDQSEVEFRVAVTRAYRHVLFPDPENASHPSGLRHLALEVEKASKVERETKGPGQGRQEAVIIEALRGVHKLLTGQDGAPDPDLVLERAWPEGEQRITTEQLVDAFYRYPQLPMLLSPDRLRETVMRGVEKERWAYFDGQRIYTKQSGGLKEADVRLDAEHELWTLAEAQREGYCFKCGYSPCRCPGKEEEKKRQKRPPEEPPQPLEFENPQATAPQKAFQELLDWARDNNVGALEWLEVECSERVQDLQQVWIGITTSGLAPMEKIAARFEGSVELPPQSGARADASAPRDYCGLEFRGKAVNFRRVYEFYYALAGSAEDVGFTVALRANLPKPLPPDAPEIMSLRNRLVDSGVERVMLRAREAARCEPG